jgi:hypothetical protein
MNRKAGYPRRILKVGARYGRLTVEGPAPNLHGGQEGRGRTAWWCLCKCGTRKAIATSCLVNRLTRSCGCLLRDAAQHRRVRTPVGKRFGALVVQGAAEPASNGESRWLCRCDCGRTVAVRPYHVRERVGPCTCTRRRQGAPVAALPIPPLPRRPEARSPRPKPASNLPPCPTCGGPRRRDWRVVYCVDNRCEAGSLVAPRRVA